MKFILLESQSSQNIEAKTYLFSALQGRIHTHRFDEVRDCLDKIDDTRQQGHYLVGYLRYEAVYGLDPTICTYVSTEKKLFSEKPAKPLIDFYIYTERQELSKDEVEFMLQNEQSRSATRSSQLTTCVYDFYLDASFTEYSKTLSQIKRYLQDGETYQVNITNQYNFSWQGSAIELYQQLRKRQQVEFSAYFAADLDDPTEQTVLSFSPELFFAKKGSMLFTRPMKGTISRIQNSLESDQRQREKLQQDEKNRSENMIIVDLIRNDLSIIAKKNSVKISEMFHIETYETLHQMTSKVACEVENDLSFKEIILALFPCGSITGAPKKRTLRIIRELEDRDRGIYTGTIGFITPENNMCFNVAIRTLELTEDLDLQKNPAAIKNIFPKKIKKKIKCGSLGVGCGIVYESDTVAEYAEMQLKAEFLLGLQPDFELIECFLFDPIIGFRYVDAHLERLANSAKFFHFIFDREKILETLARFAMQFKNSDQQYKIKCILKKTGEFFVEHSRIIKNLNLQNLVHPKIILSSAPVQTENNILFTHKTSAKCVRELYQEALLSAEKTTVQPIYDILFFNANGFLTEGSKTNLFLEKNGRLYTPALACGLLPGIVRHKILENSNFLKNSGFLEKTMSSQEAFLTKTDLLSADKIWLSNSIIGLIEVDFLQ